MGCAIHSGPRPTTRAKGRTILNLGTLAGHGPRGPGGAGRQHTRCIAKTKEDYELRIGLFMLPSPDLAAWLSAWFDRHLLLLFPSIRHEIAQEAFVTKREVVQ